MSVGSRPRTMVVQPMVGRATRSARFARHWKRLSCCNAGRKVISNASRSPAVCAARALSASVSGLPYRRHANLQPHHVAEVRLRYLPRRNLTNTHAHTDLLGVQSLILPRPRPIARGPPPRAFRPTRADRRAAGIQNARTLSPHASRHR